jgi:pyruvate kinase
MMGQIARETERKLPYEDMLIKRSAWIVPQTDELLAYDACHNAGKLGAAAIVAFTESGSTAQRVSKYRPQTPIIVITGGIPLGVAGTTNLLKVERVP